MNQWINIAPFTRDDFVSDKPPAANAGTSTTETQTVPGSGGIPPIKIIIDYLLRDEYNETICDETGDPISLEGMTYA